MINKRKKIKKNKKKLKTKEIQLSITQMKSRTELIASPRQRRQKLVGAF